MSQMNVKWHERHVLPKRASLEQRIEWHREHRAQCACRPIPARLLEQMAQLERKGGAAAPLAASVKTSPASKRVATKRLEANVSESTSAESDVAENKFSNIVLAFAHQPSVSYGGKGFG